MSETLALRVTEEEKDFVYNITRERAVPVSKLIKDLCRDINCGKISWDGDNFSFSEVPEGTPVKNTSDIDLTELRKIAENRRVTPQSVLDNALRPYRS